MVAKLLDGKLVSNHYREIIREKVGRRVQLGKRVPGLAVILIGDDPASHIYVRNKHKACEKVGFHSKNIHLSSDCTQDELHQLIDSLNEDKEIDGILVQLPLPEHIEMNPVLERICPDKDIDGFHPYNFGRLAQRRPSLRPCTPYGIMKLLNYYDLHPKSMRSTIVGVSNIVGRPMALELLLAGTTITLCHRFTKDLEHHVRDAELLIVAIGKPGIIQSEWIKPGAVVVDVGINRLSDGRLSGDIDFESAKERAGWITPVPGGVGPMTITTLLENTLHATEKYHD